MESILQNGLDQSGEFIIPVELHLTRDTIKDQLKVLQGLNRNARPTKVQKIKDEPKSVAATPAKTITSSSVVPTPIKIEKSPVKTEAASSVLLSKPAAEIPSSPVSSTSKISTPSTPKEPNRSIAQKLKDFFKERAAKPPPPGSPVKVNEGASTSSYRAAPTPKADEALMNKLKDCLGVLLPKGKMAEKLKKAAPYNFFLTTVKDSKDTHGDPLSITMQV